MKRISVTETKAIGPSETVWWSILLMALVIICARCAEENPLTGDDGTLRIDSIVPASGLAGTEVRLYGTGFSLDADENFVTLNGTPVTVKTPVAFGTLLTVIPDAATTGPVKIQVGAQEAEGPLFTLIVAPVINTVDPLRGYAGDRVSISGSHLTQVTAVLFNGVEADVIASSDAQLIVAAPESTSGAITFVFSHGTVQGPVFSYLPIPFILYVYPGRILTSLSIAGVYFSIDPARLKVFFYETEVAVETGRLTEEGYSLIQVGDHPRSDQENPTMLRVVSDGISSLPFRYVVQPYLGNYSLEHGSTQGKINIRLTGSYFGFSGDRKFVRIARVGTPAKVPMRIISWSPLEILIEIDEVSDYYDIRVEIEGSSSEELRLRF